MTAPPQTGCYHLLFHLPSPARLRVGALGAFDLPAGWYVYTGSAFGPGGLAARVARHRRREKTLRWHVDYLAAAAELVDVVLLPDAQRRECEHAAGMRERPGASVPIPRFGASDCRCPAHLVRLDERLCHDEACRAEERLDADVDAVLARHGGAGEGEVSPLEVRARRELMGSAIEELHRHRLQDSSWSPRLIRHSLQYRALPTLAWLRKDSEARRYAGHYLRFIARLTVLNQTEEAVRAHFGQAVRGADPYYHRALSILVALQWLNACADALSAGIRRAGLDSYHPDREYLDYTREAILLADALYDRDAAAEIAARLAAHTRPGATAMGVEMEFSYAGRRAIRARAGSDPCFDGFRYFHDFDLAHRLWKLGGYLDNHTGITFDESRSRGFLEVAFGRLAGGDFSRPATHDVHILAELIRQGVAFIEAPPHSLHVTLQADDQQPFTPLRNPRMLLCLLLLGGDLGPDDQGVLRERRIHQQETGSRNSGLAFSRLNAHRSSEGQAVPTAVVEFTFPRLAAGQDYEPLILALKGFQWATNPWPLDLTERCPHRRHHRRIERDLRDWAGHPEPLSDADLGDFLSEVERGLHRERSAGSGHTPADITRGVSGIEARLRQRNQLIRGFPQTGAPLREIPHQNP